MTSLCSLILLAVCSLPAFAQTTRLIHIFSGSNGTGGGPVSVDSSGKVYGTGQTIHAADVFYQLTPPVSGPTWTAFSPGFPISIGACPCSPMIQGPDGNFYGTATRGGAYGMGTVFEEATPTSNRSNGKALHSFSGADGSTPDGGVVFDAQGNLYGTTSWGGANNAGIVFELSPGKIWTERILHNFNLDGMDGANPSGGLVFDQAGNMYGTAGGGPTTQCGQYLCASGTVFEISAQGVESVLYAFTTNSNGPQDAQFPIGGLAMDAKGNLYGASAGGGTIQCAEGPAGSNITGGCGTVFEISPGQNGWTEKVIHEFNGVKGAFPFSNVVLDAQGNLYGATYEGGSSYGKVWPDFGVAYELYPSGKGGWIEKVLHNFTFNGHDGYNPNGNVALDGAGHFFGSTSGGGTSGKCGFLNGVPYGCGTVFMVTLP